MNIAFKQFRTNILFTDVVQDLHEFKIEDRLVNNSNQELKFLEQTLEDKKEI